MRRDEAHRSRLTLEECESIARQFRPRRGDRLDRNHRDEQGTLIRKVLYAQDPDGNWLEFVELL